MSQYTKQDHRCYLTELEKEQVKINPKIHNIETIFFIKVSFQNQSKTMFSLCSTRDSPPSIISYSYYTKPPSPPSPANIAKNNCAKKRKEPWKTKALFSFIRSAKPQQGLFWRHFWRG